MPGRSAAAERASLRISSVKTCGRASCRSRSDCIRPPRVIHDRFGEELSLASGQHEESAPVAKESSLPLSGRIGHVSTQSRINQVRDACVDVQHQMIGAGADTYT